MNAKFKIVLISAVLFSVTQTAQAAIDSPGDKTDLSQDGNEVTYSPTSYSNVGITVDNGSYYWSSYYGQYLYNSSGSYSVSRSYQKTLGGLDHYKAYSWGMNLGLDFSEVEITSATITFENIRNWDDGSYNLYLDLLDDADFGVTTFPDGQNPSNYDFPGQETLLKHYSYGGFDTNASSSVQAAQIKNWESRDIRTRYDFITNQGSTNLVYKFTPDQISTLMAYAEDGTVGLGFDPDCHFWNDGVTFKITTASLPGGDAVPEPTTMLLFGTGLIGIAGMRRRRMKK